MSFRSEQSISWRRQKIAVEISKGRTQRQISSMLGCSLGIVNKDLKHINREASENLKHYLNELIPERHAQCITGINAILDETWKVAETTKEERVKLASLSLARDCIALQSDLITNSAVIGEAAKFIDRSKAQLIAVQVEHNLDRALAEEEKKKETSPRSSTKAPRQKKQAKETVF